MDIFLNHKVIRFTAGQDPPKFDYDILPVDIPDSLLLQKWLEFSRNDRMDTWNIHDSGINPNENFKCNDADESLISRSPLFRKFISLFKVVYAAGGLVVNDQNEMLFIYRMGHWDLPKGKIDKEDFSARRKVYISDHPSLLEAARKAAVREVLEETGIGGTEIHGHLPSSWHLYPHGSRFNLKKTFWFRMDTKERTLPRPQHSEGIRRAEWLPEEKICEILPQTYPSLRKNIELVIQDIRSRRPGI